MNKLFALLTALFFAGVAHTQDTITSERAKDYVGKRVLLCDRVNYGEYVNISKDQPVVLYVGPEHPNHHLTLVFTKKALRYFKFDPEKKMLNKRFCVRGRISEYEGKPAIYVRSRRMLNEED